LSPLDLTALTTLSQRWNTLSWLAGVEVAVLGQMATLLAVEVRVVY
jgi:hypothetical protein